MPRELKVKPHLWPDCVRWKARLFKCYRVKLWHLTNNFLLLQPPQGKLETNIHWWKNVSLLLGALVAISSKHWPISPWPHLWSEVLFILPQPLPIVVPLYALFSDFPSITLTILQSDFTSIFLALEKAPETEEGGGASGSSASPAANCWLGSVTVCRWQPRDELYISITTITTRPQPSTAKPDARPEQSFPIAYSYILSKLKL